VRGRWLLRCQIGAAARPTATRQSAPAPPLLRRLHPLQINARAYSQSKLDESRAFQNSSILAPRYLASSPYKAPKRKSKGSVDF
jgi:hypothetical protein